MLRCQSLSAPNRGFRIQGKNSSNQAPTSFEMWWRSFLHSHNHLQLSCRQAVVDGGLTILRHIVLLLSFSTYPPGLNPLHLAFLYADGNECIRTTCEFVLCTPERLSPVYLRDHALRFNYKASIQRFVIIDISPSVIVAIEFSQS